VEELFGHLTLIYDDPNRLYTAKEAFKKLWIGKEQEFHEFLTKPTQSLDDRARYLVIATHDTIQDKDRRGTGFLVKSRVRF